MELARVVSVCIAAVCVECLPGVCVLCQVTDAAVKAFVEERPGMTFVGLLATDAGFSDFLNGEGILKVGFTVFLLCLCRGSSNTD